MRKLLAAVLASAAFAAVAQDYPNRPVTMIVPFPPGGVADITARPVAEAMGRFLKEPVVVENKAGAGGGVGMQYVSRAKPDATRCSSRSRRSRSSPRPTRCSAAIRCSS
nr:tricarboxylate transport protein TctC [uncultured bacterium]